MRPRCSKRGEDLKSIDGPPPWDDELKRAGDFSKISTGYEPTESIRYQERYQEILEYYQEAHFDVKKFVTNKIDNPLNLKFISGE